MASDLGAQGTSYRIVERDLLDSIQAKLQALQASGKLGDFQSALKQRSEEHARRPAPVEGITRTVEPRTFLVDPSLVVQHDVADHRGVIFAHQGQRINPLAHMPFRKVVLFFNGDDADQVAWAGREISRLGWDRVKPIMVRGDVFDVMNKVHGVVYFDQGGDITRRWGILHVPAEVAQEGLALRVSEVQP
ncbi:type-F conjugative transfer system protein TraW [Nitrospirillum amazonense]|uniref:type-F conjugative transfer system protein TraW n=1 Tax=Nitrospirillum amazonense TaxID=28077 RepID=UPI002412C433|nr:type-F conjugative transfer system protein TraW [Nitrospirillum amazonense]MDG3444541.1 type-F conjugative transfer system protein TraW [Nitrospirillum amazonense]